MKFVVIAASASGATQVAAAVVGKRLRVIAGVLSFAGTVNAKFLSASTDITGLYYGILGTHVEFDYASTTTRTILGHFETGYNEALNINLSGAVAVGGHLVLEELP